MEHSLAELESAADLVHRFVQPSAQIEWPLLSARAGAEVWVKHENHNPTGAFKIRGGLVYMDDVRRNRPSVKGVISATTGNHGQSVALAAARVGLTATIVAPLGNSPEKNAAMRGYGAELIEHGHDFQVAYEYAQELASERGYHFVDSFNPLLVRGVATYSLEFLRAAPDLDTVYVPIGMGSGICGMIAARDALDSKTQIVGVVADRAPMYALSFEQGKPVATNSCDTMALGMACRVPVDAVVDILLRRADRIVRVTEDEIGAAMRHYFTDTHNVAEGAGAGALAALLVEQERMRGRKVGLVLSGGNIDRDQYAEILGAAA
ncbi:MAG: threonine dehydratase [Alphaproteobacteria bacterium]|nr:threonine dehydratase [Alphaproteobacteria bacterium]